MTANTWEEVFAGMDFFVLEEDGIDTGYCYEEGDYYLIATDEEGHLPQDGEAVIIACYSAADAFLWKVEFAGPPALLAVYDREGPLIAKLAELEKAANPPV